jgi:excisionase family DNA binding protein
MQYNNETIAVLASGLAPGHPHDDDWIRVRQVVAHYNISRTTVYDLLQQGVLRSVSLRKRGNIRGIRLISKAALDGYLAQLAANQTEVCS